MRKSILAPAGLALLIALIGGPAIAAPPATDEPPFDPATIVTLQLQVTEVRQDATEGRNDLHLLATAGDRHYDVHLGPQWFVDDAGWSFAVQDALLVTGSEVQRDGKPALIAVRVERGERSLQLRDDDGLPLWAGGRRSTAQEPGAEAGARMGGMGQGGMHHGGMRGMGQGGGMQGQARQGMGMMCMRTGEAAEGETPAPMCPCRRATGESTGRPR